MTMKSISFLSSHRKRSSKIITIKNMVFRKQKFVFIVSRLTPTVITSSHLTSLQENRLSDLLSDQETNFQSLTSSQGDDVDQGATEDHHSRGRRFVFVNRNKFVISSTITTYAFVPTILTETINLLTPVPNKQCAKTVCANCIPPGYIVCPA